MSVSRDGVLAAGTFLVDRVVLIDRYPAENTLASIESESRSSGGCPYTILKDLALLGAAFPLTAIAALGADADGDWIRADCAAHGIDTYGFKQIEGATTSYTYAMTVRATGRRTFFHQRGANALLAADAFDFDASDARVFVLGYLLLLDALDTWIAPGVTNAARVLERARSAGLTTVVDLASVTHPEFSAIVRSASPHVDHLLLNEWEASIVLGHSLGPCAPGDLLGAARELAALGVRAAVVIHCEGGVVGFDCRTGDAAAQGAVALPAPAVIGATGAGDAFAAGYILALHAGESTSVALEAGVCSAAACLQDASASGGLRPLAECLAFGARFGFRPFSLP